MTERAHPLTRRRLLTGLFVTSGLGLASRELADGRTGDASGGGCRRPTTPSPVTGEPAGIPYDLAVQNNGTGPSAVTVRLRDPVTDALELERTLHLGAERTSTSETRPGGALTVVEHLPVTANEPLRLTVEGSCPDGCTASTPLRVTPTGVAAEEAVVVTLPPTGGLDVTTLRG